MEPLSPSKSKSSSCAACLALCSSTSLTKTLSTTTPTRCHDDGMDEEEDSSFCILPDDVDVDQVTREGDRVLVATALSTIFERGSAGNTKVFEENKDTDLELCSSCAATLTRAYVAFSEFLTLIQEESEIARKLVKLQKHQGGTRKEIGGGMDKERGRAKKNTLNRHKIIPKAIQRPRRSGRQKRVQNSGEDGSELGEEMGLKIKEELQSDPEFGDGDLETVDNYNYIAPHKLEVELKTGSNFGGDDDGDDSHEIEGGTEADYDEDGTGSESEEDESDPDYSSSSEYDPDDDFAPSPKKRTSRTSHGSAVSSARRKKKRTGDPAGSFPCPSCPAVFAHRKSYTRHYSSTHEGLRVSCSLCDKTFTRPDHLLIHTRTVHGKSKKSSGSRPPPRHPRRKNGDSTKCYTCPLCEFSSEARDSYRQHMAETHSDPEGGGRLLCPICGGSFRDSFKLRRHLSSNHTATIGLIPEKEDDNSGKLKPWGCDQCGKSFTKEFGLKEHLRTHGEGDRLSCDFEGCSILFKHASSLARHRVRVHGVEPDGKTDKPEKPEKVPCETCGKMVVRHNMKLHMATHTGEKTALCSICGRSFASPSSLKMHLNYSHGGREPLVCSQCGVVCKRPKDMRAHLELHALGEKRPYPCAVPGCGKAFRSEKTLRSHGVVHSGEKAFPCPHPGCGRSFNRVDNMRVHFAGVHEGKVTRKRKGEEGNSTATARKRQGRRMPHSQKGKGCSSDSELEESDEEYRLPVGSFSGGGGSSAFSLGNYQQQQFGSAMALTSRLHGGPPPHPSNSYWG